MSAKKNDAGGAIQACPDAGVFTWDLSTDTVYADSALAELFGLDAHEACRGLPIVRFLDRIDPADKPLIARAIHEAIVTGEAYQQDYSIIRPNGSKADVSAFGRCFRDENGNPRHYAGVVCLRTDQPSPVDALFWHCLQAHNIAKECGRWEMVEILEDALRQFGHQPDGATVRH
jgi:hypothetical protein